MAESDAQRDRRRARQTKLDQAFEEYARDLLESGDMEPGILVGWIAGMTFTHFELDGRDRDGMLHEEKPNQNVYLARGIADATAERFQQTATGYFDDSDL